MDDLKLLGRNESDLENEIKIVQTISKDTNMNFGLEKCARICWHLHHNKVLCFDLTTWYHWYSILYCRTQRGWTTWRLCKNICLKIGTVQSKMHYYYYYYCYYYRRCRRWHHHNRNKKYGGVVRRRNKVKPLPSTEFKAVSSIPRQPLPVVQRTVIVFPIRKMTCSNKVAKPGSPLWGLSSLAAFPSGKFRDSRTTSNHPRLFPSTSFPSY